MTAKIVLMFMIHIVIDHTLLIISTGTPRHF